MYGKKALVFSNSREETEYLTATFRQIAKRRGDRDIFLIHHGNLSSALREEAEIRMKDEDSMAVTCATVTMELGIDIGRLERVLQNESPEFGVKFPATSRSFGQTRRAARNDDGVPRGESAPQYAASAAYSVGTAQSYRHHSALYRGRFIEPPQKKSLPFSLLFHQTLSVLASSGELTAERLAGKILSYPGLLGGHKRRVPVSARFHA